MKLKYFLSAFCISSGIIFGIVYVQDNWPQKLTRAELLYMGSCDLDVIDGIYVDKEDMCVIEHLEKRCKGLDQCFVGCVTGGKGVDVGGGCTHLCNYMLRKEWSVPEEALSCINRT
ncbi:hypothetical protein [Microbulbifer sp. JMSA003]|uniref:hypothetical protein n=1 Tax=Microbulbifer sp. JMSA003 TaxID=3243369 RepID=UPI00403A15DD